MKKSELKQIIKEEIYKIFNEIKIERPKKIWDFTKYNPKFNPADIKIGDTIKTKKHSFIVSDIEKGDEDGYTDVNGSVYWYVFEKFDNPLSGAFFSYSSTQLEKFNNSNINEIKVEKPFSKLRAFKNPSGAIYLLFKGTPINSPLKKYVSKIGHLDKKTKQIKFDLQDHTIGEFKTVLNKLNIPYKVLSEDGLLIGIDEKIFNIKPIDKWTIYDEDVEKENWFNNVNINEIKINNPSSFETLRRNLIKLIEFDRDNYGYDDSEEEHAKEVIENLKNATNEKELRSAVNDWVFGDKETTQHYFDLATYKEKFDNPLLNT